MFRALLLTAVLVSGAAVAGGRAGFRAAFPFSISAYVEQTLYAVPTPAFTVEVAGGLELRAQPWTLTPYTAVYAVRERLWFGVMLGRSLVGVERAFNVAFIGGWSW